MTIFSTRCVRCLTPTGAPGHWQPPPHAAFEAMREASAMDSGKRIEGSPADAWGPVTAEWRRLSGLGWQLETERDA